MSNRLLLIVWLVLVVSPALSQHSTVLPAPPAAGARSTPVLVAGRVTLADAKPAAGAQVYITWITDAGESKVSRLPSDARGVFEGSVSLVPKPNQPVLQVTAVLPGQGIVSRQTPFARKGLEKLDLRLNPATTLTGRLIRADGRPAAGVPMSVAALNTAAPILSAMDAQALQAVQQPQQAADVEVRRAAILPAAAAQFHCQTDSAGRFVLTGLPRGGQVVLKPGAGLLLAPGSLGMTELRAAGGQEMGTLVAVEPGRIKVRVLDKSTRTPAAGVTAQVTPVTGFAAAVAFGEMDVDENSDHSGAVSNAQGELEFAGLRPGDYKVLIDGRTVTARVEEGRTTVPAQVTLRRGMLHGRLLDPNGRPLAHFPITLLMGTPHSLAAGSQSVFRDLNPTDAVKTGTDGSFTLTQILWGSPAVTIRSTRGDDLAEWTGSPDKLGPTLTLKMRANALVTVSGQLIDPQRRALTKVKFETLHWLDSPRSTWFATAHQVTADARGHFRVAGLERGESFSLVTGRRGQDNVEPQAAAARPVTASFESPRFTTPRTGEEQELGDVMVHPVQNPEEIQQIYGDSDPVQQARLTGFLPSPGADDVKAARQVLGRYQAALKAGDLDVLHQLCSRVSPGWSAERRGFLEHCALTTRGETEPLAGDNIRAIPLVPRAAAAMVLGLRAIQQTTTGDIDTNAGIRELDLNPNFIFLAEQRAEGVGLAGVLCKEDGAWRMVIIGGELAAREEMALFGGRVGFPVPEDRSDFTQAAPPLGATARAEAEQTALKYLKFWAQNRTASMLALTAPISSLYTHDIQDHKERLSRRLDEGVCPLADTDTVALQPVDNLTVWDLKLLMSQAPQQVNQFRGQRFMTRANGIAGQNPANFARRGDTVVFRYTAEGQWYLIELVRYDGKWSVLEPALAL